MNNKYVKKHSVNLHDKCGVFGVINSSNANYKIYLGLHALQHRGQDSSGIVTFNNNNIYTVKKQSNVITTFNPEDLNLLKGTIGIGHVRYPTFGLKYGVNNVQPFTFKDKNGNYFATCHNGNLTNYSTLKKELINKNIILKTDSDSEILGHLLINSKQETLKEKLIESLNKIVGAFCYVIGYQDLIIGIRDFAGIRPLVIGKNKKNEYIIASETVALDINDFKFYREINPGEVVFINKNGKIESFYYTKTRYDALCAMEYVYLLRPDSIIKNKDIHSIREKLGKELAIEKPVKADIVIGVPDSSLSSALGYAKESKIPYEYGLIKNRYIGRSFIAPSQEEREKIVKMKLNVNTKIIEGKDIVLVDDSIVRGTTMMGIVKLLKQAKANKIHLRISSPEIKYPSFYGINIQNKNELALNKYTKNEYLKKLKYVDSLEFLSIEKMEKAIGRSHKNNELDISCFNGEYIIDLCDYKNYR